MPQIRRLRPQRAEHPTRAPCRPATGTLQHLALASPRRAPREKQLARPPSVSSVPAFPHASGRLPSSPTPRLLPYIMHHCCTARPTLVSAGFSQRRRSLMPSFKLII